VKEHGLVTGTHPGLVPVAGPPKMMSPHGVAFEHELGAGLPPGISEEPLHSWLSPVPSRLLPGG